VEYKKNVSTDDTPCGAFCDKARFGGVSKTRGDTPTALELFFSLFV
jgi:hypothetical protein